MVLKTFCPRGTSGQNYCDPIKLMTENLQRHLQNVIDDATDSELPP